MPGRVIERVKTTSYTAFQSNPWCELVEHERSLGDEADCWVFSDGSSTGWYSAVVVERNVVRRLCNFETPGKTRNVGAEIRGAVLGLTWAPRGARVVVVHDYLGIAGWLSGRWWIRNPVDRRLVETCKRMIVQRDLCVSCTHHAGHQRDDSDFTRWNRVADKLCGNGEIVCRATYVEEGLWET